MQCDNLEAHTTSRSNHSNLHNQFLAFHTVYVVVVVIIIIIIIMSCEVLGVVPVLYPSR
jgi:hypothetical protein